MTDVSTTHPNRYPYIELVSDGRKIDFKKDCLEEVDIFRKVEDGDWQLLIKNARTPYVDTGKFSKGTKLAYRVQLGTGKEREEYQLKVFL